MGKIFNTFGKIQYRNESEVSQNFVIPLLIEFLGYKNKDVIPEKYYPVKDIYSGRSKATTTKTLNQKPDYVICLEGDISNPKFIVDSKNSDENIDEYLDQLKSYAIGVKTNLLLITNGITIKAYDVNHPIFIADDLKELDKKFDEFFKIFGKQHQKLKRFDEIYQEIDFNIALSKKEKQIIESEKEKRKLELSDFNTYLNRIIEDNQWHYSNHNNLFTDFNLKQFDPTLIHSFKIYFESSDPFINNKEYTYDELINNFNNRIKLIVGESGIGKTILLKYLFYKNAEDCLKLINTSIPIFITLRSISDEHTLYTLIKRELQNNYYKYPIEDIHEILIKNKFIILLDGYDEVNKKHLHSLDIDINDLLKYDNLKFILTTRYNRILNIKPLDILELLKLNSEKIEIIAKEYLGNSYFKFISDIQQKGLINESSNFLILLLMIYIFDKDGFVPDTLTKITKRLVDKIKDWENNKFNKLSIDITWDSIDFLLSDLALSMYDSEKDEICIYDYDKKLIENIKILENNRDIPIGFDKNNIIECLCSTNIINFSSNNINFWHRIFLNFYASLGLYKKLSTDNNYLLTIKNDVRWLNIIVGSAVFFENSTNILKLFMDNYELSTAFAVESNKIDNNYTLSIIDRLVLKTNSQIIGVREQALSFLKKIKCINKYSILLKLFNESKFVDVKMFSLEEMAEINSNKTKKLIYENINWDERPDRLGSSSSSSVMIALSHYGENEFLLILDLWQKKPDMFTADICINIFKKLIREKRITETIIEALVKIYLSTLENEQDFGFKRGHIKEILCNYSYEKAIDNFIDSFNIIEKYSMPPNLNTVDILSSYTSSNAIDKIYFAILSDTNVANIKEGCIKALYQSKGFVPLDYFVRLSKNENDFVKFYAIKSLGRFNNVETKELISKLLNSPEPREQRAALEAAEENRLFYNLVSDADLPKLIHGENIRILLNIFKKFRSSDSLPIIKKLFDNFEKKVDYNLNHIYIYLDFANLFCMFGQEGIAINMINKLYIENKLLLFGYDLLYLLKIVPDFSYNFRNKLISDIFNKIKEDNDNDFLWNQFLEFIEKINDYFFIEEVKDIIMSYLELCKQNEEKNKIKLERPLRTLSKIGTTSEEIWLLDIYDNYSELLERFSLNRFINCLANFGTIKSIQLIKNVAKQNIKTSYILDTCFYAYRKILIREGKYFDFQDEDLIGN